MALLFAHALAGAAALAAVDAAARPRLVGGLRLVVLFAALGCLPDLDILDGLIVTGDPLDWHGGGTRSLAFAAVVALSSLPFWSRTLRVKGLLAVFVAVASHVVIGVLSGPAVGLIASHGTSLLRPLQNEPVNGPVTLFHGAWCTADAGWFNGRNLETAAIELAIFAPVALLLTLVVRRRQWGARRFTHEPHTPDVMDVWSGPGMPSPNLMVHSTALMPTRFSGGCR